MKNRIFLLTRLERLQLIAICIEGATGVAGASLILTEGYPKTTLCVLVAGAVATKIVNFLEKKQVKSELEKTSFN